MLKQNYQKVILYKSQTFLFCDNCKLLCYTEDNKSIYIWKKKNCSVLPIIYNKTLLCDILNSKQRN